jgi:hypothetical protein
MTHPIQHPRLTRVNYLHSGQALDALVSTLKGDSGVLPKRTLLSALARARPVPSSLADIVLAYGGDYTEMLDLTRFKTDIDESITVRDYFRSIGCRGFSFEVGRDIEFGWHLRPSINFSLALYTAKDLYYPSRIRRYLPRVAKSHVSKGRLPAVAFALGRYVRRHLFVLVLQSDLVFQGPSCVREHFRGWRKVLFGQIRAHVMPGTRRIYLCRSEDVQRTCHPAYDQPPTVPEQWRSIYEGTAAFFGMRRTRVKRRLNIQCLQEISRRFSTDFYMAEL